MQHIDRERLPCGATGIALFLWCGCDDKCGGNGQSCIKFPEQGTVDYYGRYGKQRSVVGGMQKSPEGPLLLAASSPVLWLVLRGGSGVKQLTSSACHPLAQRCALRRRSPWTADEAAAGKR
jgi:hypothetical protein